MAETKTTQMKEEKKTVAKHTHEAEHKHEHKEGEKHDHSHAGHEHKHEQTHEHKPEHTHQAKTEHKHEEKKEVKKVEVKRPKKDHAIVRNDSVHISKRHGMYICSFIKGKTIDSAIKQLEEVIILKRAVPFKGEIPHRKGMMSGRYPVAASKIFINMLKNLKGGVLYNGMDSTKTRISNAYTNFAPRPQRRGGTKGKRASVFIEAREIK